jgi:hypothetical protein
MKTNEFKKILKPLIEKTIREVLLEEGVLSRVVAEVARGFQTTLVESKAPKTNAELQKEAEEQAIGKREKIKRLNESAGLGDVFSKAKTIPEKNSNGPLTGINPHDSGVDITNIQKLASGKWKQLMGNK